MLEAYLFNDRTFASEAFDDEVVVLDVGQGTYFTLNGWIVEVWNALRAGQPIGVLVAEVARHHGRPAEEIAAELAAVVAELSAAGILVAATPSGEAVPLALSGAPYRPLAFERHSDMEELLTFDPIHDVDPAMGWPHARPRE